MLFDFPIRIINHINKGGYKAEISKVFVTVFGGYFFEV